MNRTYIDIVFEGAKFIPTKLKDISGLKLDILAEYGKIAKKGRYKGKPSPYGLAVLKMTSIESNDLNSVLKNTITQLLKIKEQIRQCGVDEITLDLENISKEEVEITIDKDIIKQISNLNANLDISSIFEYNLSQHKPLTITKVSELDNSLIIELFQSSIFTGKSVFNQFSLFQSDKIRALFREKIDKHRITELDISQADLTSALMFYLMKYSKEENLENIPPLDKVLKESL